MAKERKGAEREESGLNEVEQKIDQALEDVEDEEVEARLDEALEEADEARPEEVLDHLQQGPAAEGGGKPGKGKSKK